MTEDSLFEDGLPDLSSYSAPGSALTSFEQSIDGYLQYTVTSGASDLHLSCGKFPKARIDGELEDIPGVPILDPRWLAGQMSGIMTEEQRHEYGRRKEIDFSYSLEGYGRFRVNFFVQLGTPAAVLRVIPQEVKTLNELKLPESLFDITSKPNGLVLVTGPTGSGKSTTLAAMIEERNRTFKEHIMTIEDPIEFVYESKKALINQREVGSDTNSFNEALKRVLRQDPEVILIGELRDPETMSIALSAAETGHLVFGTLHTQSAAKSLNRIIDSFSADKQGQVKAQLADTLQAIISQTLLRKMGGGRVAATEILVRNNAIANLIREGKTGAIRDQLQTGHSLGMHTLDQELKRLVQGNVIEKIEAEKYITDATLLQKLR